MKLRKREKTQYTLLTASDKPVKLIRQLPDMNVWEGVDENGESVHLGIPEWKVQAEGLDEEGTWFTFHWDNRKFIVDDVYDED